MHTLRSIVVLLAFIASAPAPAQSPPLTVAVKEAPPFVFTDGDEPEGLAIDLWERVADRLGLEFRYEAVELDDLLEGVASGRYDAGVGAISITAAREEVVDLSHGYFTDGLGIAVPAGASTPGWLAILTNLFTPAFLSAVGALALLLLVVGVVVWLVERTRNSEQFNTNPSKGVGDGFWFAAVTMTTVGYGDKAPATLPGRLVALVWMFASIIVISAFTGSIASSLTAAQIETGVRGPEDLASARIGAVEGTATVEAMRDRRVAHKRFGTIEEGLNALAAGELDAFVHDGAIMQHRVTADHAGVLRVLDSRFDAGAYALALPPGSPLREDVNLAILTTTLTPDWEDAVREYLGTAR
ncbi:MAG: transporter substrate-binding domain-containing protein [Planctomycetota bacterium]